MFSKQMIVTGLASVTVLAAALVHPPTAQAMWPSCGPGVYTMCLDGLDLPECYDDPISLCHDYLQRNYSCDGNVIGAYCQVNEDCDWSSEVVCYVEAT